MLDQLEMLILGALQSIYDQFGWGGVFSMMIFENATGITPSEIVLSLAGWMLIEAHGKPPSLILLGGLYAGLGSVIGASITYFGNSVVRQFQADAPGEDRPLDRRQTEYRGPVRRVVQRSTGL